MTQNSNAMKRAHETDAPSCGVTETANMTDKFQRLLEQLDAAETKLAQVEEEYFSPESLAKRGGCSVVSGYNTLLRPLLPSSFFSSGRTDPSAFWSLSHEHRDDCADIEHRIFSLSSCSSGASLKLQQSLSHPEQNICSSGTEQEHLNTNDGHSPALQPLEQFITVKQEHPSNDPIPSSPSQVSLSPPPKE